MVLVTLHRKHVLYTISPFAWCHDITTITIFTSKCRQPYATNMNDMRLTTFFTLICVMKHEDKVNGVWKCRCRILIGKLSK